MQTSTCQLKEKKAKPSKSFCLATLGCSDHTSALTWISIINYRYWQMWSIHRVTCEFKWHYVRSAKSFLKLESSEWFWVMVTLFCVSVHVSIKKKKKKACNTSQWKKKNSPDTIFVQTLTETLGMSPWSCFFTHRRYKNTHWGVRLQVMETPMCQTGFKGACSAGKWNDVQFLECKLENKKAWLCVRVCLCL